MYTLRDENQRLEYKTSKNSLPKSFWPTYSSFANTHGGLVVLGVEEIKGKDGRGVFKIAGVSNAEKIKKELFTAIHNPETVNYCAISDEDVNVRQVSGLTVIEVFVREAPDSKKPVYLYKNIANTFMRSNDGDRKATEEELKNMIRNSRDDLDSELLNGYDVSDLDEESIHKYRESLSSNSQINYASMTNVDLLKNLGAMKKDRNDDGNYKLTIGGLLFFGKYNSITDEFPHFHLDYFNKTDFNDEDRWIDRVATGDPRYPDMNIFKFYLVVLEKLRLTVKEKFSLNQNLARSTSEDVEISLREALTNALIHADYFSELPIKITAYNNSYEFFNPGSMKISVEEFARGGDSRPRNNVITTLFRRAGYSERAGSGGPKIFQVATENKFRMPEVKKEDFTTTLKLWKVDIVNSHPDLGNEEKNILSYITKNGAANLPEIMRILNMTRYHALKATHSLLEKNLLEVKGKGRATHYSLPTDSSEYIAHLEQLARDMQTIYINKEK